MRTLKFLQRELLRISNKRIFYDDYVVNQVQLCKRDPVTVKEALKCSNAAE